MSFNRTSLARLAWAVITLLALLFYFLRIPHRIALAPQLPFFYIWEIPLIIVWISLAALILWRTETSAWTFGVAVMLSAYGASYMQDGRTLNMLPPLLAVAAGLTHQLSGLAFFGFAFLFPDARPIPRWLFYLVMPSWAVLVGTAFYFPDLPMNPYNWPPLYAALVVNAGQVAAIAAPIYRYRITTDPVVRQQMKWVVFGFIVLFTGNGIGLSARLFFWGEPVLLAIFDAFSHMGHAAMPLATFLAIMRYRLWDIDRIINRTLVYAALTGSIALIYTLVVTSGGFFFQGQANLGPLIGTGLVAFLFMPLRDRLQTGVNRLMYGERENPTAVLVRLGAQLESSLAPDQVPPTVVQTVAESLRVPYVALLLLEDETYRVAASAGEPVPDSQRVPFPLMDQGELVGQLVVGRRCEDEEFSPLDLQLLRGLARQAGQAVHTIRLTQALQRSREQLVTAREEERRRMRNDLHDGLGPSLSGFALVAGAIDREIERNPDQAREMVRQLAKDLQGSLQDVRRLIYNLRPPLLDDLGLVGALKRASGEFRHAGLEVQIEAPEAMPALPAAVEVAAFRIVQEALNNVVKHARASHVRVHLAVGEAPRPTGRGRALLLTVVDNGVGVDPLRTAGIGLFSMRERAAELGGACLVEPDSGGGTCVEAWLPLGAASGSGTNGGM